MFRESNLCWPCQGGWPHTFHVSCPPPLLTRPLDPLLLKNLQKCKYILFQKSHLTLKLQKFVMARLLTDTDLSKVAAKVIPCGDTTIRRRFAMEFLNLDHNTFKKIAYNQRDNCEEIVYECLQKWKEIRNESGEMATVQDLVEIFEQVSREEHGWIRKDSYKFLYNYPTQLRKYQMPFNIPERGLKRYNENYTKLMAEIAHLQKEKERLEEDRARVQEKLRMKEEIARAPFWDNRQLINKRCHSLLQNNCSEDCAIKKCRSF